MSNDLAMNHSGYDRIDQDFYPTPFWITSIICDYLEEHFQGYRKILEPACGEGHISKVMGSRGFQVSSYDLVDRGYGIHSIDFLTHDWSNEDFDGIVTNPPYGKEAEKFLNRGLDLIADEDKFMVTVLRNEYDCAKERMYLFQENPYYYGKVVLTKRPLWIEPKPGEKSGAPRHNYAFYIHTGFGRATPAINSKGNYLPFVQYAHPSKVAV